MSDTATPTIARPELTPEEKARRARVAEIRQALAPWPQLRRTIKAAYGLPHRSEEHALALKAAAADCAVLDPTLSAYRSWWLPSRHHGCERITALHRELAALRGKIHGPAPA